MIEHYENFATTIVNEAVTMFNAFYTEALDTHEEEYAHQVATEKTFEEYESFLMAFVEDVLNRIEETIDAAEE